MQNNTTNKTRIIYSDNVKQQVIELKSQGITHAAIAEQLGVSLSTVHNWVKKFKDDGNTFKDENESDMLNNKLNELTKRKTFIAEQVQKLQEQIQQAKDYTEELTTIDGRIDRITKMLEVLAVAEEV